MKRKLLEQPPNAEEQRVILEYLKTLECVGDLGWDALVCHYEFVMTSMKNCFEQFSTSSEGILLRTPSQKQDPQSAVI